MLMSGLAAVLPALVLLQQAILGSRRTPAVTIPADSAKVARDARRAQESFERTRRANLPFSHGSGGRCDVRIGRFCYWHDDGASSGPEEPGKIATARDRLLDNLARAAARLPGDRWIAGQRVRYLAEAGKAREAVEVARACRADAAWCSALAGFSLHAAGEFAAADSAFAAALAGMDVAERCRWADVALLLEGDARDRYRKLPCSEREAFERTFWALARPLHLLGGNDLRTEHLSRVMMTELQRTARSPHHMSWGDDMHELMVRYGWPTRWSRETPLVSRPMDVHVVGHEPHPSFDFVPDARAIIHPDSARPDDWTLRDRLAHTRYAPSYARAIAGLEHQLAFFRRGDSALLVVGFDTARDTAFSSDSIAAALATAPASAPESSLVVREWNANRRDVLTTRATWSRLIVSVEAHDSAARAVARTRVVARPPMPPDGARVTLSDLLLFNDPDPLPRALAEAAGRARGSLRLHADSAVGLYWEMYGVQPDGEELSYAVTVRREGTPWYRRAAERLGLADRQRPVRMRWQEPAGRPGEARNRSLSLDLSTLPAGRYVVELTLEAGRQPPVTVGRVVQVER